MSVEEIIKRIQSEKKTQDQEIYNAEGLLRLQEVMKSYEGDYKLIWSDALLAELQNKPVTAAHQIGVPLLDNLIGGFRPQQLVTVSAHSKHGKTAFALFLMEQLERLNPLMIPLEQSNEELVEQRRDNGYTIPKFLSPRKLAARVTTDWIEERIVEGIAKYDTKMVVIDHLGYIDDLGEERRFQRENLAYRIQVLMQTLKTLAKKWGVTIVLLVHISQADEGKPPTLQDLKGSSSILQESDMVMMLWRKNSLKKKVRVYENRTMVSVLANRRTGKNGNVGLEFNTKNGRFEENHKWVDAMERDAQHEVDADNDFNET